MAKKVPITQYYKAVRTASGGYYQGQGQTSYWTQRSQESLTETFKTMQQADTYLTNTYEKALRSFVKDYKDLLAPYTDANGNINYTQFKADLMTDKNLYGKYQRFTENIDQITDELKNQSLNTTQQALVNIYGNVRNTLTNNINLEKLPKSTIEMTVKRPWTKDGREFSDRIWQNTTQLNRKLRQVLSDGIATGKSLQKQASEIRNYFGTTTYNAQRIVRTESQAIAHQSTLDSYKDLGFDQLQVIVEPTSCAICQDHDKEIIDVATAQVGIDIPPYHPNCTCTITPYFSDAYLESLGMLKED